MKNLALPRLVLLSMCLSIGVLACSDDEPAGAGQSVADVTADVVSDAEADVTSSDTSEVDIAVDPCAGLEDGEPCDDGNACTTEDACSSGVCTGGVNVQCDGGGPCRKAFCDPADGCTYTDLADGHECSLGCFGAASCIAGECEADPDTAVPIVAVPTTSVFTPAARAASIVMSGRPRSTVPSLRRS